MTNRKTRRCYCIRNGRLRHAHVYVVGQNHDRSRTRAFPHWCTRRGSHNREVTRVKKDVRVNLAGCISGDELIPPISLRAGRPGLFLVPVSSSSSWTYFSAFLCLSLSLPLFPLSSSPTGSLSPSVHHLRASFSPSYLLYRRPSFWTVAIQHARFSPPTGEFLFIYGGLNEP